jgi:hypothetical protein
MMSYANMTLSELAAIVRKDWKKVYFGAVPYLEAMAQLETMQDMFGADDAQTIVLYFLSNSSAWRGEVAKAVKAELSKRAKR